MSGNNFNFDPGADLGQFEFDPAEIPDPQLEKIRTEIDDREQVISDLNQRVIEEESQRKQLESTVEQLQSRNQDLQEKVRKLQSERSTSRPREMFANFGKAVEDADADLADTQYRLADLQVEMKANVLQDEEGMKFHLPGVEEDFAAENLSTLNFRLAPKGEDSDSEEPDVTYDPVPDLKGMALERARTVITREGFSVGTVEPESDAETGTVVDQFPSPRSIAEPGTAIDLTVSWDDRETEETDDSTGEGSDRERLESRLPPLEEIDGIGPTYAERLRSAGIETILDLSEADPERAGDVTHTSMSRAEGWIERATVIVTDITR